MACRSLGKAGRASRNLHLRHDDQQAVNGAAGQRALGTVAIRVPKFGALIRNFIVARVIRTPGPSAIIEAELA